MAKCTGIRCPMQYGYKVEECNRTECPYRTEPVTNADRIRAMNDETLSAFLWCFEREEVARESDCIITRTQILKWLQSPVEKGG